MDLINRALTFIIIILLLTIAYISLVEFSDREYTCGQEICKKIKKKDNSCKNMNIMDMDYNHVRQRKVRRELEMQSKEITESRKRAEDIFEKKNKERKEEIELESDREFIISLDYEINKLIAELIRIKRDNKKPENTYQTIEKINSIYSKLKEETKKINRIDRSHIKLNLLEEYKEILETLS